MSRWLYTLLFVLAMPLVLLRLWWKGRRLPAYRQHLGERFGHYLPVSGDVIWLHAVSVGETHAAAPLVRRLLQAYPDCTLLLTQMTPTGREAARQLFGDSVRCVYLPYDLPWLTDRFLRHFRPRFGILMETEVWPNLVGSCQRLGVPLMLVNARLSERSAKGYQRLRWLAGPAFAGLDAVAAQTIADAERIVALGARRVEVCGNIKFDVQPPGQLDQQADTLRELIGSRLVLLLASTRDGEEALLLDAFRLQDWPENLLLVMVPRHPQRFDEVLALMQQRGLSVSRRSQSAPVGAGTRAWLGDSMGEMFAYYRVADVAIIGGSIAPLGGQNLIEACAVGTPVLFGPHMFNFAEASQLAIHAGAARQADNAAQLMQQAAALLADPASRRAMGEAGRAFSVAHRGATDRIMGLLASVVGE